MKKRIAYRYDTAEYSEGDLIASTGDYILRLTGDQREAELLIRAGREDGKAIRATSIYPYLDRAFAEFAWSRKEGMHLYEVEIDEEEIVHIGGLKLLHHRRRCP